MKKILIAAVVVVLLLPVAQRLMPKPFTSERFQAALKDKGLVVTDAGTPGSPSLPGAMEQFSMVVNGAQVGVYRFDDEGKIATQLEYQKPDAGSAIVETWNLSESLGAAKPTNKPVLALRNRMFLCIIAHEDKELRGRIGKVFSSM